MMIIIKCKLSKEKPQEKDTEKYLGIYTWTANWKEGLKSCELFETLCKKKP